MITTLRCGVWRRARVAHRCNGCGEEIGIGDTYSDSAQVSSDHGKHSWRLCECCEPWTEVAARLAVLSSSGDEFDYYDGALHEALNEHTDCGDEFREMPERLKIKSPSEPTPQK